MRLLYCRSNRLIRMFNKCSQNVLIEWYRSYIVILFIFNIYFIVLICGLNTKKTTFSKLRVTYNNVYFKVFGLKRQSSSTNMSVLHIYDFEALMRKSIFDRLYSTPRKLYKRYYLYNPEILGY